MKKLILILTVCFGLTGCALLPRLTFEKAGVTPTSTEKSNKKEVCQGELKVDATTGVTTCSKGYVNIENDYKQIERKYTFQERIANFIRGLAGWSFFLIIAFIILCPGVLGWLIGRVYNIFNKTLTGTVRAISNFRNKIPTITISGVGEVQDPTYVKAVDALLDELENEHKTDPAILKTISDIRLKLKIEDTK